MSPRNIVNLTFWFHALARKAHQLVFASVIIILETVRSSDIGEHLRTTLTRAQIRRLVYLWVARIYLSGFYNLGPSSPCCRRLWILISFGNDDADIDLENVRILLDYSETVNLISCIYDRDVNYIFNIFKSVLIYITKWLQDYHKVNTCITWNMSYLNWK